MSKYNRRTWEDDLKAGPILTKEIYYRDLRPELMRRGCVNAPTEIYGLLQLYRYQIIVGRYDTTPDVWGVFGDAFHEKRVSVSPYMIKRDFKLDGEDELIAFVEQICQGPFGVERWLEFCRTKGYTTTTEETGPASDDLVAMLREDL